MIYLKAQIVLFFSQILSMRNQITYKNADYLQNKRKNCQGQKYNSVTSKEVRQTNKLNTLQSSNRRH